MFKRALVACSALFILWCLVSLSQITDFNTQMSPALRSFPQTQLSQWYTLFKADLGQQCRVLWPSIIFRPILFAYPLAGSLGVKCFCLKLIKYTPLSEEILRTVKYKLLLRLSSATKLLMTLTHFCYDLSLSPRYTYALTPCVCTCVHTQNHTLKI